MSDFIDAQNTILARVEALGADQKFDVFEVAIPLGYERSEAFIQHEPYVLVSFGGKAAVAEDEQGITGTRDDIKRTSVGLEIVGNAPLTVRLIGDILRNSLDGFIPNDSWGELVERMAGDYTVRDPNFELWPVRYAQGIVYNTNADA
jgi:hypothetical protein